MWGTKVSIQSFCTLDTPRNNLSFFLSLLLGGVIHNLLMPHN